MRTTKIINNTMVSEKEKEAPLKYLVAVRIVDRSELFGFPSKKARLEFINEILDKYGNIEYATSEIT